MLRFIFVIFALLLSLNSVSAQRLATTGGTAVAATKSIFREVLPAPAVDSGSWNLYKFRGAEAEKSITSSFRRGSPAVSIDVTKPGPQRWNVQFAQNIPGSLAKGEVLRLHFWARSKTNNSVEILFGHKTPKYERLLGTALVLTPSWREFSVVFKVTLNIPEDWATLMFFSGTREGNLELADISLQNWGLDPKPMPKEKNVFRQVSLERAPTHEFFRTAEKRIDSIRKGGLTVRVVDQTGAPVSKACIQVQQLKHKFRFGTWIYEDPLFDEGEDGKKYRETILSLFNCVVPANVLKWEAEDYCDPTAAERLLTWCAANHLPVKGHNLLWPEYHLLPRAVQTLRGEQLRRAIEEHIIGYATRYRGRVYAWDVINEAIDNHEVPDDLGKEILVDVFKWARQADPTCELAYSEYDILNNNGGNNDAHRAAAIKFIDYLLQNKAPVNMFADQGHITIPLTHADKLIAILNEMAEFKLPIEISEYEIPVSDDKTQANYLKEFLTAIFSHPAVDGFFIYEFWEGTQWANDEGRCMFHKDWTPRPAVAVYKDLVFRKWWTNVRSTTKGDGLAKFRVFLGEHKITVSKGDTVVSTKVSVDNNEDAQKIVTVVLP